MTDTHDVISAFLDDEPFDANRLAAALSEPSGRELLIDLIALRHLTQSGEGSAVPLVERRPRAWRGLVAAAVLVALAGGYFVGERRSEMNTSTPPPATRVVAAPAAWQDVPLGRMR